MCCLHVCVHSQSVSRVQLFATSWTVAPPRLLCPRDFPGKSTGVGCHFLLQRIFQTQVSNQCLLNLLHWKVDSFLMSHQRCPLFTLNIEKFQSSQTKGSIGKKKEKSLTNECLINNIKYKICRLLFLFNFFTTHGNIGLNALHNILKVWDKTVDSYIDMFNLFYFKSGTSYLWTKKEIKDKEKISI